MGEKEGKERRRKEKEDKKRKKKKENIQTKQTSPKTSSSLDNIYSFLSGIPDCKAACFNRKERKCSGSEHNPLNTKKKACLYGSPGR